MAVVFLLGPGMWAADDAARPESPPMATRRRLAAILTAPGALAAGAATETDTAVAATLTKLLAACAWLVQ